MTPDQRNKLAKVLIDQAFTCSEKGHHDDAESLMKQSVRVRFHDEIEKIINGDKDLLGMFAKMQLDKDPDKKLMARSLIQVLMEDKRFLKMYKPIFSVIEEDEEENQWNF